MKICRGRFNEQFAYYMADYWGLSRRAYNALQRIGLFTKRNVPKLDTINKLIVSVKGKKHYATLVPLIGPVTKNEISQWYYSIKRRGKKSFLKKIQNMPKVSV